jgi:hypothetical protein
MKIKFNIEFKEEEVVIKEVPLYVRRQMLGTERAKDASYASNRNAKKQ